MNRDGRDESVIVTGEAEVDAAEADKRVEISAVADEGAVGAEEGAAEATGAGKNAAAAGEWIVGVAIWEDRGAVWKDDGELMGGRIGEDGVGTLGVAVSMAGVSGGVVV